MLQIFSIVSLLLALMADLCLPLSAGKDTFELHSPAGAGGHGEAESRAALHLCSVCFSAQAPCTRDAVFPDVLHPSAGTPRTLNAAAEDTSQAPGGDLSPSAASSFRDHHPQYYFFCMWEKLHRFSRPVIKHVQCPPLILAPLVNMTKGGCENKSALFILFIFHSKNSNPSLK